MIVKNCESTVVFNSKTYSEVQYAPLAKWMRCWADMVGLILESSGYILFHAVRIVGDSHVSGIYVVYKDEVQKARAEYLFLNQKLGTLCGEDPFGEGQHWSFMRCQNM
jgi:hypothetical protein